MRSSMINREANIKIALACWDVAPKACDLTSDFQNLHGMKTAARLTPVFLRFPSDLRNLLKPPLLLAKTELFCERIRNESPFLMFSVVASLQN